MKTRRNVLMFVVLVLVALLAAACGPSGADVQQANDTANLMAEAYAEVGMPDILNFTELRLAKELYELRDEEGLRTWSYMLEGPLLFCLGESIGYGIPYAAQFTNPDRLVRSSTGSVYEVTLPQPEPNGLFMPDSAEASWLMLPNPLENGTAGPIYSEPKLVVSPFPIPALENHCLR